MTIKKLHFLTMCGTHKKVEDVLNQICGRDGTIDFNKIVPMPKELHQVRDCSVLKRDMKLWERGQISVLNRNEQQALKRKFHGPDRSFTHYKNAYQAVRCMDKYGYFRAKDWAKDKWGIGDAYVESSEVKWQGRRNCQISFLATPTNGLSNIVDLLQKSFPKVKFSWGWDISGEEILA
ncbi:MAG: hypothetical protein E7021_02485 [Alphaproteobacteria bacterium]|nr:hypothetical protein [Alphaproteobacteria bacterium]